MVVDYLSMSRVNFAIPDFTFTDPTWLVYDNRDEYKNAELLIDPDWVMGSRPVFTTAFHLMYKAHRVFFKKPHQTAATSTERRLLIQVILSLTGLTPRQMRRLLLKLGRAYLTSVETPGWSRQTGPLG